MFDIGSILDEYGWYILLVTVVLYYIYTKIKPSIDDFLNKRAEKQYAEKYHKNPDLFVKHVTAQQSYAQKLQEKYNESLAKYKEKQEEKERKRLEALLQATDDKAGHRLGDGSTSSAEKKSFKPEYNPLMGSGSSSSYRPPKRSCCGGGGCG